ncbi:short-chain dehydrogenase [Novosphingobium marinum]|uniref:NAD(P)-dependent dehydrogenase (Short-subunit alcohol dehydrogenase family) n=1 Tax=Novosphingobium marinum TaxID=1514948 RepID=A0A7Z0BT58_9SPHN|nr:SDR family NAD(P)-dependent oxidoreductase [Novosphingobium marinum]NYH93753.1 NAD(P)-dependent dehydrogenase (short-subunit alcohol dehydrogenase family) [Novosphingobium marinum]GGC17033.1 short-chain dehydrogenase [Novosphingobium marinum]
MENQVLKDKVAIVTGAGRGIGRAIAHAYAKEGAMVVVASRTPSTVERVAKEITDAGGTAIGFACDVGHRDQVFACVEKAVEEFGALHIVVNNAQGFGTEADPQPSTVFVACEDTDEDEWEYTFRTGATASLWFMKAAFPHLKKAGFGRIVNFASSSGQVGFEGNTCYNATKEAIRALTRTAAREWGQYGITVNCINPALETRAFDKWKTARPEFVEALKEKIPVRRLGDPEVDAGPIAVFLASEGSGYMTGGTFMLEGGMHTLP